MTTDMRRLISLTNGVAETLNENEGSPMSNFGKWGSDLKEGVETEASLEEEEMVDPEAEGLTDLDEEAEEGEMEELDEETMDELDENVIMAMPSHAILDHIASLIEQGYTESHKPGFTLHVGPEVRGDEFAMDTIAAAVRAGQTSGSYPHWSLETTAVKQSLPSDPALGRNLDIRV